MGARPSGLVGVSCTARAALTCPELWSVTALGANQEPRILGRFENGGLATCGARYEINSFQTGGSTRRSRSATSAVPWSLPRDLPQQQCCRSSRSCAEDSVQTLASLPSHHAPTRAAPYAAGLGAVCCALCWVTVVVRSARKRRADEPGTVATAAATGCI